MEPALSRKTLAPAMRTQRVVASCPIPGIDFPISTTSCRRN
jgi:hypothetical protein